MATKISISGELQNKIAKFLESYPDIHEQRVRKALIYNASLDKELENQINFEGATAQFCPLLVRTLARYGTLGDRRNALVAVLEEAKRHVGLEKKAYCDTLREQLQSPIQREVPQQSQGGREIGVKRRFSRQLLNAPRVFR